ncbi:cupin domain-containing protein [Pseudomonas sp. H3(2019)]|uniref:cupin domain-containing protein n=1 Tax=Pseudomonas sp. H3(2019) TaxID=2598724 RepID=UPI001192A0A4|nr:cupin domain-containing protein [Pseudomonas sp. H3(2019)]TVT80756.1 cupin domain-containing protein [Pseudomonas sp. H3(2019)]
MTDSKPGRHTPSAQDIVAALDLEPHVEGGYYRRTFQSDRQPMVETAGGRRYAMTSIYYLLTGTSPVGHFHLNKSDIVHYYHVGDAIQYFLIYPDGALKTVVMGNDVTAGQCLQLHVPGGVWKASQLMAGPGAYGLISEAVSPGFDFADMQLGSRRRLGELFPEHSALFERLARE